MGGEEAEGVFTSLRKSMKGVGQSEEMGVGALRVGEDLCGEGEATPNHSVKSITGMKNMCWN